MSELSPAGYFFRLSRRQLTLALRRPVEVLNPILFFALVVVLFPLGLGPESSTLSVFAPGILWIVALLANLLGSDGLFRADFEDGTLDQLLLPEQPVYFAVLAYLFVHWLLTGVLLALLSPLFALMLSLPGSATGVLLLALLLGSGTLTVLGAVGAALTVGLRRGGALIAILVTPFYMPVLIFGAGAVNAAVNGIAPEPQLALLASMLCLAVGLGPLAISAALRISIDG